MGCDIHVYLEKNVDEKYDIWQRVGLYRIDEYDKNIKVVDPYNCRNYDLFAILAGVRGQKDALVSPRGLPKNLSQEVEKEEKWWEGGYHTPTWYDLSELYLYRKMYKDKEDYGCLINFVDSIEYYLDFAGEYVYEVKPNQYRVIMWFDS